MVLVGQLCYSLLLLSPVPPEYREGQRGIAHAYSTLPAWTRSRTTYAPCRSAHHLDAKASCMIHGPVWWWLIKSTILRSQAGMPVAAQH